MKRMNGVAGCRIIALLFFALLVQTTYSASAQKVDKKIATWYIYKEGENSFKDLMPYKDLLASVSVFGNPSAAFMEACHQNGIEVYHAVSGKGGDIDSPEKRESLVASYLAKCDSDSYDGIDLDFEALNIRYRDDYSAFLKTASDKLHQSGRKLSQCVGFYNNIYLNPDNIFYDVKVVAATCDLVRVMCYDMYYAPGRADENLSDRIDFNGIGPTSSYPFTKAAMSFWARYVPVERLVMGLPAYSNDYVASDGWKGSQVYGSTPAVNGTLPSPIWLWFERLNMYIYPAKDNKSHIFYASDAASTVELLKLADEMQINNIGFWHFGSVSSEMWEKTRNWINAKQ